MPKRLPKPKAATPPVPPPVPTPAPVPVPPPAPVSPPAPTPVKDALPIVYDKLSIAEYSVSSPLGPLTVEDGKTMLGWETEKSYQARMVAEKPDSKPEHWLYGDSFHCLNTDKEKVRCWNNANNRPFDMGWSEDLIHTILRGQWAGPLMIPGETVNGETVRISRYGRVLSGQHQLTALALADEWLQKARQRTQASKPGDPPSISRLEQLGNANYPAWDGRDHPVIETIVVTGLSEDERVLRTIDYVKPRTVADMLFTMELFRDNNATERKEMTRMLASAIDFAWTRADTKGYRTHPEIVGFLERHRTLLKCVQHLFLQNLAKDTKSGRKISKLRLSPGQASAICYLMGSSGPKTDGDAYRWGSPPCEKGLDWSYLDKALAFWTGLADSRDFIPVRTALNNLVERGEDDESQGLGGHSSEKLAIIAKAWEVFRDHPAEAGPPFSDDDLGPDGALCLSYSDLDDKGNLLPNGQIKLLDVADFYGIDCPEVVGGNTRVGNAPPTPPPPTAAEIEKGKQDALRRRAQQKA